MQAATFAATIQRYRTLYFNAAKTCKLLRRHIMLIFKYVKLCKFNILSNFLFQFSKNKKFFCFLLSPQKLKNKHYGELMMNLLFFKNFLFNFSHRMVFCYLPLLITLAYIFDLIIFCNFAVAYIFLSML